jgi:hypothetical protein
MKNSIIVLLISFLFIFANCKKDETANVTPATNNSGSLNSSPASPAPDVLSGIYSNSGFTDGVPFGSAKMDSTAETSSPGTLRVYKDYNVTDQYVFFQTDNNTKVFFKVIANGNFFNLIPDSFSLNGDLVPATGLKSFKFGDVSYDGYYDLETSTLFIGIKTSQPQASSVMPVNNFDKAKK